MRPSAASVCGLELLVYASVDKLASAMHELSREVTRCLSEARDVCYSIYLQQSYGHQLLSTVGAQELLSTVGAQELLSTVGAQKLLSIVGAQELLSTAGAQELLLAVIAQS